MRVQRILSRLSRRTSTGRFIPEVDGLRFVAISTVVLYHVAVMTALLAHRATIDAPFGNATPQAEVWRSTIVRMASPGSIGVELFFVLSAFILGLPFAAHGLRAKRPVDIRRYFLRRLTRLEPPYLLALILSFFAAVLVMGTPARDLVGHLFAGVTYSHTVLFHRYNPLDGPLWSLEIEIQFYLLVPLLARLFAIRGTMRRRLVHGLLVVSAPLYQQVLGQAWAPLSVSLLRYLPWFLAGFLLADLYVLDWNEEPRSDARWDMVALLGWPLLFLGLRSWPQLSFASGPSMPAASVLVVGLVVVLYCAAFKGRVTRRVLANRWITTVGGMCYSIYLLHYPVMILVGRATGHLVTGISAGAVLVQLALMAPVVLAAGLVFFVLVERPCMEPDWPWRLRQWAQEALGGVPHDSAPIAAPVVSRRTRSTST